MTRRDAKRKPHSTAHRVSGNPSPRFRSVSGTSAPTIALCVIARNEERFIADCLDSARPYVDEVIVVDTGSTDRTREIAREHGARVEQFEWCDDFAAARNAAIDHATTDWIFMLDADERLDPSSGPQLQEVVLAAPPGTHSISPVIESRQLDNLSASSTTINVPRLFPRRSDIRFVGAIHEIVTYLPDPAATTLAAAPQLKVIHYGYDLGVYKDRDKDARNIALLEKAVAKNPDDGRLLYFLLQQHYTGGRHADAAAVFERFLEAARRYPKTFTVEGYYLYFAALIDLGETDRLEAEIARARELEALGGNALDVLANYCLKHQDFERAEAFLKEMVAGDFARGLTLGEGFGGWATHLKLAELADRTGRVDTALRELELAAPEMPPLKRSLVARQAASFAARHHELERAARWLEQARLDTDAHDMEAQQALFQVSLTVHRKTRVAANDHFRIDAALAQDNLQLVFDIAMRLATVTTADVVRLHAVAARLRSAGEVQGALMVLNRAIDGPAVPQTFWLLAQTLTELGRYADAALALEAFEQLQAGLLAA
jgi:glycosyltransferase involved in cell wall biosynthesis